MDELTKDSLHFGGNTGLFENAIAMSGVATDPWAVQWEARDIAERLGDMVGCPRDSSRALVECLRTKDSKELVAKTVNFRVSYFLIFLSKETPTKPQHMKRTY